MDLQTVEMELIFLFIFAILSFMLIVICLLSKRIDHQNKEMTQIYHMLRDHYQDKINDKKEANFFHMMLIDIAVKLRANDLVMINKDMSVAEAFEQANDMIISYKNADKYLNRTKNKNRKYINGGQYTHGFLFEDEA